MVDSARHGPLPNLWHPRDRRKSVRQPSRQCFADPGCHARRHESNPSCGPSAKACHLVQCAAHIGQGRAQSGDELLSSSFGATLRVVRASNRTPSRSSNPRIAWLSADGDTPSCLAARVKRRSYATVRTADNTLRLRVGVLKAPARHGDHHGGPAGEVPDAGTRRGSDSPGSRAERAAAQRSLRGIQL